MVIVNVRVGLGVFNCVPEGFDYVFHANSLSVLRSKFFRHFVCKKLGVVEVEFRII